TADTFPIEFVEENHENNHENQQSDYENQGRDHKSYPVNDANIPMLEKHIKFLKTNLNAKLDKILANQKHESKGMINLISILKKLAIHFPTQGTGGYEQNNVGDGTIEPIVIVPIACSGDTIRNNDKQQDIGISTSDDITRRLNYEEREEKGAEFCSKDKYLIAKEVDEQRNQHIVKGVGADCLNEYL
ncbi:hypothetical protein HAX54_004605, partial [Datura stramonium]|nr:hypothetical protein [Datura stramonium]